VEYFVDVVNRATNMMTPIFTAHYVQNDLSELRRKYLLITRISATLALFGGGMIIILAKAFIVRWMGAGFEQSYTIVVVLMSAMIFEVIGSHSDNMFYAVSQHRYLAGINSAQSMLILVLAIVLAPRYGIVGVALGTAIPLMCIRLFVIPPFVTHFIGLPTRQYYRNLLPVAAFTVTYLAAVNFLARPFLEPPTYGAIVAVGMLATPLYVVAVPFIVLDARERSLIMGLIPGPLRRWRAAA
jgi:O-antigen/teichoic acid export membrane protein